MPLFRYYSRLAVSLFIEIESNNYIVPFISKCILI